jgi:hypothetical protein
MMWLRAVVGQLNGWRKKWPRREITERLARVWGRRNSGEVEELD